MNLKYKILLLSTIIGITLWKTNIFNTSFAYTYNLEESTLFYEEDTERLEEKIKIYLNDIDDLLIVNSSFDLSDTLSYNYDFLVYFAIDYILKYKENFQDKIVTLQNYSYTTIEGYEEENNQYIPLEEIYKITDKYFGIKNFEIINDNVKIVNNYISLTDYTTSIFSLKINDISVQIKENQVLATVNYEMNTTYLYTFENQNNVLKIKNIEVLS